MATYNDVQINGNTKTTNKYTCESANLSYTIIGENISEDFKFINNISSKLDEMLSKLQSASSITDAFDIEGTGHVSDISKAYNEIKNDVQLMQTGLNTLHSTFMTDIANVNAELENNFGYWAFNKPRLAGKTTETIETPTSE